MYIVYNNYSTDPMAIYYFVFRFMFKKRKTMAGCALMAAVMLLYLTAVVRRNAADDGDNTGQLYFV